ncbi:hypothetical protein [Pseudoneobacillus sp. C159]
MIKKMKNILISNDYYYSGFIAFSSFIISMTLFFIGTSIEMNRKIVSEFNGIVFGITSGTLGLMGLVAIFISLNSQHKIEKCRELFWELQEQSYNESNMFTVSNNLKRSLLQYAQIYNQKEKIIQTVIEISKHTLKVVILLWTIYAGLVDYSILAQIALSLAVTLGVFILAFFHIIIGKLGDAVELSSLDNVGNLVNLSFNSKLRGKINDLKALITLQDIPNDFQKLKSNENFKLYEKYIGWRPNLLVANYMEVSTTNDIAINRLRSLFYPNLSDELVSSLFISIKIPITGIRIKIVEVSINSNGQEYFCEDYTHVCISKNLTQIIDLVKTEEWCNFMNYEVKIEIAKLKYKSTDDTEPDTISVDCQNNIIYLPHGISDFRIKLQVDSIHDMEIKEAFIPCIDEVAEQYYKDMLQNNNQIQIELENIKRNIRSKIIQKQLYNNELTLEYDINLFNEETIKSFRGGTNTENGWINYLRPTPNLGVEEGTRI